MAMVVADLADELKDGLGFGAKPTSAETTGLSLSIITEFQIALVNHPIVSGVAPSSGGPLTLGAAAGGIITGMTPASLAGNMKSNMGKPSVTAKLLGMATAMTTHFMTGVVNFASGTITGICTNTAVSPGPLTLGAGAGGIIAGYSGPALATLMASAMGFPSVSSELQAFCTKLVDYIMANSQTDYGTGSINGPCPAGGGPVVAVGIGGLIS